MMSYGVMKKIASLRISKRENPTALFCENGSSWLVCKNLNFVSSLLQRFKSLFHTTQFCMEINAMEFLSTMKSIDVTQNLY